MNYQTSLYYVVVQEGKTSKIVPHTKKGKDSFFEFIGRDTAVDFLKNLVENNPGKKFRLIKETTHYKDGPWMTKGLNEKINLPEENTIK